jgi:hypothetical protein
VLYKQTVVPTLANARTRVAPALKAIIDDPSTTGAVKAQLLQAQVVAPLSQSLAEAQAFHSPDPAVNEVHRHAVAALAYSVTAYQTDAQAFEMNSSGLLQQGRTEQIRANTEWDNWLLAAAALPK